MNTKKWWLTVFFLFIKNKMINIIFNINFSLFNFKFEPKTKYEPIEKTAKKILKRNKSVETTSRNENKLKFLSPGGAYCVYKGGGGSGGCVVTGPYGYLGLLKWVFKQLSKQFFNY